MTERKQQLPPATTHVHDEWTLTLFTSGNDVVMHAWFDAKRADLDDVVRIDADFVNETVVAAVRSPSGAVKTFPVSLTKRKMNLDDLLTREVVVYKDGVATRGILTDISGPYVTILTSPSNEVSSSPGETKKKTASSSAASASAAGGSSGGKDYPMQVAIRECDRIAAAEDAMYHRIPGTHTEITFHNAIRYALEQDKKTPTSVGSTQTTSIELSALIKGARWYPSYTMIIAAGKRDLAASLMGQATIVSDFNLSAPTTLKLSTGSLADTTSDISSQRRRHARGLQERNDAGRYEYKMAMRTAGAGAASEADTDELFEGDQVVHKIREQRRMTKGTSVATLFEATDVKIERSLHYTAPYYRYTSGDLTLAEPCDVRLKFRAPDAMAAGTIQVLTAHDSDDAIGSFVGRGRVAVNALAGHVVSVAIGTSNRVSCAHSQSRQVKQSSTGIEIETAHEWKVRLVADAKNEADESVRVKISLEDRAVIHKTIRVGGVTAGAIAEHVVSADSDSLLVVVRQLKPGAEAQFVLTATTRPS